MADQTNKANRRQHGSAKRKGHYNTNWEQGKRNKIRRLRSHLVRFPGDDQSYKALERWLADGYLYQGTKVQTRKRDATASHRQRS